MNRTLNVVRMQLVNRQTFIWVPLIVLGGSLIISIAIWVILNQAGVTANMYGGGAQAPLWYFGVVGVQAMTLTFPFSQAMSLTRREFYLGTLLTAALTSGILAVVFVIGGAAGLHADVIARADERVSLGPMTLPHQLARVVLLEQLYRAFRIIRGEPYHR